MAVSDTRRITFVVNDDDKKFIVVIPQEIISVDQLSKVACNFQYMAETDCSIFYDAETKTYRLVQMCDSSSVDARRFEMIGYAKAIEEAQPPQAPLPKSRIPRPPNAWIIYRSQKSKEIRQKLPHVTAGYISTLVSQMWKQESRQVRLQYNSKAIAAQKLHKQMYPNYKYNANCKKNK